MPLNIKIRPFAGFRARVWLPAAFVVAMAGTAIAQAPKPGLSAGPVSAPSAASKPSAPLEAVTASEAQRAELKATLQRVQAHYKDTRTLRAKFDEVILAASGGRRQRQGTVYFEKPGKMRWEFGEPHAETIVSDGKDFYDYAPDLNQVMRTPVRRAFKSAAPVAFLLGMGDMERDFKALVPPPSSDGLLHVSLVPKGGGDVVELGLDPKNYNLASARVADQIGNITTLNFSDLQSNVALDGSLFHFEAPKGADVIDAPSGKGEPAGNGVSGPKTMPQRPTPAAPSR